MKRQSSFDWNKVSKRNKAFHFFHQNIKLRRPRSEVELKTRIFKKGTGRFCRTVWPVEEDLLWKWSDLYLTAGRNNVSRPKRSILFTVPTEIFGNSAWWKASLRQPIECILPHPVLHFSWEELPSEQKLHKFGENRKFWKRALVILLSQGKWSFFRSLFQF